jgi:hypothetical protein
MYQIRQEAAGALWNLSFDDRNREAIAAVGGVEALVSPFASTSSVSHAFWWLLPVLFRKKRI